MGIGTEPLPKVPMTIRVSYDLLKELLKLPDDVDLLGIYGVDDLDGCFQVIIETPVRHIKTDRLGVRYRKAEGETFFDGFA